VSDSLLQRTTRKAVPIVPVPWDTYEEWLEGCDKATASWLAQAGFRPKPGSHCLVPGANRRLATVVVSVASREDPFALGHLAPLLPAGVYRIDADWPAELLQRAAMGWALGAYQFTRYKKLPAVQAKLLVDPACSMAWLRAQVRSINQVRDLINTPAEDMMPEQLAAPLEELGEEFDAQVTQIVGDRLRRENYPAIHAVGRAAAHEPRLVDLRWGARDHPKVTLVGKGVCFDSGGLDLKSAAGMRYMKKDMGGAAHAIGLARMVMSAGLKVRLRVLVAAVENAVSGNAYRPGDVLASRKGLSIEIDNTDAEGRVILCDALAEAGSESPDLVVDFATLTGAARVALGTELPAMFCNRDDVAQGLSQAASAVQDPLWRLPLYQPYRELIDSKVADIANSASRPYGGAITAALFLADFVPAHTPWAHFDIMAWNLRDRPGRPEGGEAMGIRAVFEYLRQHYGN
jgi:leucyl aminopeptidase